MSTVSLSLDEIFDLAKKYKSTTLMKDFVDDDQLT